MSGAELPPAQNQSAEPFLLESGAEQYDLLVDPSIETGHHDIPTVHAEYPALTDEQVRRLSAERGHFVTAEEVGYMNSARARGIHHGTL